MLNFQKVAELIAKMQKNGKNGNEDSNNNMQISLINAAMDTGSVDMLQMILNKAKESEKSKETSSQESPEESNSKDETVSNDKEVESSEKAKPQNPKFLENAFKAWKSKIKKPEADKNGDTTAASAKPKYRRPSCPNGVDEKYFLDQNRRHCVSQEEERAEDLEEYERNREKAYQEEVAKAEEMLKNLKARSRRKHSVDKML